LRYDAHSPMMSDGFRPTFPRQSPAIIAAAS
jgi:hypothetical protein